MEKVQQIGMVISTLALIAYGIAMIAWYCKEVL
jgi:hypothetical protein